MARLGRGWNDFSPRRGDRFNPGNHPYITIRPKRGERSKILPQSDIEISRSAFENMERSFERRSEENYLLILRSLSCSRGAASVDDLIEDENRLHEAGQSEISSI